MKECLRFTVDIDGEIIESKYESLMNLLNKENVRIVKKPCEDWKKLIEECSSYDDKELLIQTLEKNIELPDIQFFSQAIYEMLTIITRDSGIKMIAKLYNIPLTPNKKSTPTNNWREFLANQRK
ncbi:MAG: hypothetical protein QXY24_02300 [Candidatus Aenigmatarchaeota archaeon]